MIKIEIVSKQNEDLEIVIQLFNDYLKELNEDICFQNFEKEFKNPLIKYGDDQGVLLIARWNNIIIGCVAYTKLSNEICEMKRLYVRPTYRNLNAGKQLAMAIIEKAKKDGYQKMVLDTLEKLKPAVRLYQSLGFIKTNPYYLNPLQGVIYMEKNLND